MTDYSEYRYPVEVYLAAIGQPARLAERLRSDQPLTKKERDTLAALIEGKLLPPKLKRGGAKPRYLLTGYELQEVTLLSRAENTYRSIREAHLRTGEAYGTAELALERAASIYKIDVDVLLNYIRRPKSEKQARRPLRPSNVVEEFHLWLYEHGLTNF